MLNATYALYSLPICADVSAGSKYSDRRITTMMSMSSAADSARIASLMLSSASVYVFSLRTSTSSSILAASPSMDRWKLRMPSWRVMVKMRCISDRVPNGWARKRSRTPDMTAAGLAILMTFFITVYGMSEWILLACANSSGELSSARKRW